MDSELHRIFKELADEFNQVHATMINDSRLFSSFRLGFYPEKGKDRYNSLEYSIESRPCFNRHSLNQLLRTYTSKFTSSKKVFDYVIGRNLWPREVKTYEEDMYRMPSISVNFVAGFLSRNFELNNYELKITTESFETAIKELEVFFNKSVINITTFLSLHGPSGEVEEIVLAPDVSIKKADYDLVKLFGLFYSTMDSHYVEMFEGDYVLQINSQVNKKNFMESDNIEKTLRNKWFHVPLLAATGNIEYGKIIRVSNDWPLVTIKAPNSLIHNTNRYNVSNKSNYAITINKVYIFEHIAKVIQNVDLGKLDNQILFSIERLKKSKASENINDRIVELALAFEYLINTTPHEVTLQLCLKAIKLFDENNTDELIYRKLYEFYDLRSKVIHGKSKVEGSLKNKKTGITNKELIDYAEIVIQKIILRLIEMNQYYSFNEISSALTKALYIVKPLKDLLEVEKGKRKMTFVS